MLCRLIALASQEAESPLPVKADHNVAATPLQKPKGWGKDIDKALVQELMVRENVTFKLKLVCRGTF
jgi:hypothetical protein